MEQKTNRAHPAMQLDDGTVHTQVLNDQVYMVFTVLDTCSRVTQMEKCKPSSGCSQRRLHTGNTSWQ